MNKTHWKKAFNKDYLGAHDLDEGQELKLTIKKVEIREVVNSNGKKESCDVATFTDASVKPMILNATACKQIQRFSGSRYIEDWGGTHIQVYVKEGIKAFGEIVDALRIRDEQPRMEKDPLNPLSDKWSDAVNAYRNAEDKDKMIESTKKYYEITAEDLSKLINEASEVQDVA